MNDSIFVLSLIKYNTITKEIYHKMKIKDEIIERIDGHRDNNGKKDIKPAIMKEMCMSSQTINNWVRKNKENGWLTSKPVLLILCEKLSLNEDAILTDSTAK